MRNPLAETRGPAHGGPAAPAADAARPPSRPTATASFAFLMAEGGQRYRNRLDELFREVGRRGRLWSRATPAAWGFGGFLIGAMFWHAFGVWGLLGSVVPKGHEVSASVVARPAPKPAVLANCTALALDRATGQTYSVPCPDTMPAIEEASGGRRDFAAAELR